MKLKLKFVILTVLVIAIGTYFFTACNKISPPEIYGCDQIKYNGEIWTIWHVCVGGHSWAKVTMTKDNGKTATFNITCSNGCINTVTVDPPTLY